MGIETFPDGLRLGVADMWQDMDRRSGELLLAFVDGFSDMQIAALLSARGLAEARVSRDLRDRVRSQSMRWVRVGGGRSERTVARALLTEVGECWLASPVYMPRDAPHPANASAPIPGILIAQLADGADATTFADIAALGLSFDEGGSAVHSPLKIYTPAGLSDDGFELVERLAGVRGVTQVQMDWVKLDPFELTPQSTLWPKQWNLIRMGMPSAWNKTTGDPGVLIAVIDSGVDLAHPAISPAVAPIAKRAYFSSTGAVAGTPTSNAQIPVTPHTPQTMLTTDDTRWHGTAVTGIITGGHASASGVAGIAPNCRIMPIRVKPMSLTNVAAALRWAAANGARVANFSISASGPDMTIYSAVLWATGTYDLVICGAAGNSIHSNDTEVVYPARYPEVMAVGAIDAAGKLKRMTAVGEQWLSRYGVHLSVLAPGLLIPTTDVRRGAGYNRGGPARSLTWFKKTYTGDAAGPTGGNYIAAFTGTSAAVAHVSGLAGLLFSQNPGRTRLDVMNIIESCCDKVDDAYALNKANGSYSMTHGYGLVNAAKSLAQTLIP